MARLVLAPYVGAADVRRCDACGKQTFHDAVERMMFSPSGARKVVVWQCEEHPLPDIVTDEEGE